MLIFSVVASFALCYVLMPVVIALSWRLGAVDVPRDTRRMHVETLPRAGGLGIVLSVLTVAGAFGLGGEVLPLLVGGALMLLVGLADDIFCLSAPIKLLFQIAAATAAVLGLGGFEGVTLVFAVLWVVLLVNAHNLVDGMDGLFGGAALLEALFLAGALWLTGRAGGEVLLLLAASLFAFRFFNRYPALCFAGDCGSESVGFLLGALSLPLFEGGEVGVCALSPLFLFAYPLAETFTSVLRRLTRGRSPFLADRAHFHHRLWAAGLSVPECVGLLHAVAASLCGVGLLLSVESLLPYAVIACIGAVVVLLRAGHTLSAR